MFRESYKNRKEFFIVICQQICYYDINETERKADIMKKNLISVILCAIWGIGSNGCADAAGNEKKNMNAVQPALLQADSSGSAATGTNSAAESGLNDLEWNLKLVNAAHPIGEFAPPELVTLRNGVQVDSRIYPDLQAMFDAMRAEGLAPITGEGYRTYDAQSKMMSSRISEYRWKGYSRTEAESMARAYVADPGTSEHQLGIAVDINSENDDNWSVYSWLAMHAHEYGFILRYPQGSESITGYAYEPWHYRYVGREAAAEIHESGQTLEEYLGAA